MAEFSATVDVAVSAPEAFALLADPMNRAEWDSSVRQVTPLDGATGEVGDRYGVTLGFYGKAIEATYEIADLAEPSRIVFTTDGKARGRDTIEIEPTETGSTVSLHLTVTLKGPARFLDRGLQVAFAGIGENAVTGVARLLAR